MTRASIVLLLGFAVAIVGCEKKPSGATESGKSASSAASAKPAGQSKPVDKTEPKPTEEKTVPEQCKINIENPEGIDARIATYLTKAPDALDRLCVGELVEVTVSVDNKKRQILVAFFRNAAPKHSENFINLAKEGFYNGTIFHRVMPGFMIQGGDPNTKDPAAVATYGSGGPNHRVRAEFNRIPHTPGILSMARSNDPDSAGSQFFMVHGEPDFLNGQYTVFGAIIKGFDVVDDITKMKGDPTGEPGAKRPNPRTETTMRVITPEEAGLTIKS